MIAGMNRQASPGPGFRSKPRGIISLLLQDHFPSRPVGSDNSTYKIQFI